MPAGATYTTLATTTLSSAQTSITFSSISAAYTDLVVVVSDFTTTAAGQSIYIEFNSDSSTIYSSTWLNGNGSAASSARRTGDPRAFLGGYATGTSTTEPCMAVGHIMNYSNTTTFKTLIARWGLASAETNTVVNLWRSTSAINAIRIFTGSTMKSGTIASLYGIAAA
jgi:hypothetical protein